MIKNVIWPLGIVLLAGCSSLGFESEDEQEITLEEIPPVVLEAAMAAVEGIEITEAEIEMEDGQTVYELTGLLEGEEIEIELTPEGEVLEIEED